MHFMKCIHYVELSPMVRMLSWLQNSYTEVLETLQNQRQGEGEKEGKRVVCVCEQVREKVMGWDGKEAVEARRKEQAR
jgi:hypothetical protein